MKIMMTGGGTLGPVTPLLAVVSALRRMDPSVEVVWVGTQHGPERLMVEKQHVPFFGISAPKLDRHAPLRWLFIPCKLVLSLVVAFVVVRREQPQVVVTAGGYVSVPVVWVAKCFGIPVWVHQQDVRSGLANKLMAPAATQISVAWAQTLRDFPANKTMPLGNPVREEVLNGEKNRAAAKFGLNSAKPTVLVLGGGTGSAWINAAMVSIAPELTRTANILHITGRGKQIAVPACDGYASIDLVSEGMNHVFALADLVVCRAGLGTISELSALQKPAIIIPMPNSHQEDNTAALQELQAAIVLDQRTLTPQVLLEEIQKWLSQPEECRKLGARIHAALPTEGVAEKLAQEIVALVKQ